MTIWCQTWVFWRTNWAKRDYWAMLYYKPRSNVGLKFSLMPIHQCSTIYASIISRLLSWIKNTWDCVMNNAELQEANGEAWVRKVWECSTKSAYHLLTNEVADSPSVWVKLWKVRAPQRCKVHLWLVCMIGCLQIMQRCSVDSLILRVHYSKWWIRRIIPPEKRLKRLSLIAYPWTATRLSDIFVFLQDNRPTKLSNNRQIKTLARHGLWYKSEEPP